MEFALLKKIGLTEGEIRVYSALLSLGSSPTGQIMKKSGISSSKIYFILDKLIHKGLVSYIVKNNVRNYQITNPQTLLEYLEKEKENLEETKKEVVKLIPEIEKKMQNFREESAQVYKGVKGIGVAYFNILNSLKKGDTYCFFAVSRDEAVDERVTNFFTNFHRKRIEKGIKVKVISDSEIEKLYKQKHVLSKGFEIRHYKLTLPVGIVIGKDRILSIFFGADEPVAHEIISQKIAERYQEFFDKLWKIAKD